MIKILIHTTYNTCWTETLKPRVHRIKLIVPNVSKCEVFCFYIHRIVLFYAIWPYGHKNEIKIYVYVYVS